MSASHMKPAVCKQCGGKFYPALWGTVLLVQILGLPALCASMASASRPIFYGLLIAGGITALVVHEFFVPLSRA